MTEFKRPVCMEHSLCKPVAQRTEACQHTQTSIRRFLRCSIARVRLTSPVNSAAWAPGLLPSTVSFVAYTKYYFQGLHRSGRSRHTRNLQNEKSNMIAPVTLPLPHTFIPQPMKQTALAGKGE